MKLGDLSEVVRLVVPVAERIGLNRFRMYHTKRGWVLRFKHESVVHSFDDVNDLVIWLLTHGAGWSASDELESFEEEGWARNRGPFLKLVSHAKGDVDLGACP